MAELVLNVDFTPCERPRKKEAGSRKHQRFVRRRRELERRGALRGGRRPATPARGKPRTRGGRGRRGRPEPEASPGKPQPLRAEPCPAAARDPTAQRSVGAARDSHAKAPARGGRPGSAAPHPPSREPAEASRRVSPGAASLPPPPSELVAIDCEMVGTGPGGRTSALARCSVVSYEGAVLYDRYVRPAAPIVDYRTRWSGIRPHHMRRALPFRTARRQVVALLGGKVVVGHSVHNDFKALQYRHPPARTRDTCGLPPLNRRAGLPERRCVALKRLTRQLLGRHIQVGSSGHSSVEDARATMELYRLVEAEWEQHLLLHPQQD